MPKLTNAKHERFCQLVSQGWQQTDAYMSVFSTNSKATASANASRLRARPEVSSRIAELEGQLQRGAVEGAGVDRESVLRGLTENLSRAVRANNLPAANRSLELLGKSLGLFIERFDMGPNLDHVLEGKTDEEIQETTRQLIFAAGLTVYDPTDDELREYIKRHAPRVGLVVTEADPKPDEAPARPH